MEEKETNEQLEQATQEVATTEEQTETTETTEATKGNTTNNAIETKLLIKVCFFILLNSISYTFSLISLPKIPAGLNNKITTNIP